MTKRGHCSYCLFKKQTSSGKVWYAKFWDEETCRYNLFKSTGIHADGRRERRREAEESAQKILDSLVEKKFDSDIANRPFIQFILDFWKIDSKYAREKSLLEKKPLSLKYIEENHRSIKKHVEPYHEFKGLTVGKLTRSMVRAWKLWAAEKGLSGRKINIVIQAMRVPVRDAYRDEKIPVDPFLNVRDAVHNSREKGILTPSEVSALIRSETKNQRWRLAVLLGSLCGLRRGEIRGLKWGDILDGIINVQHNWVDGEGLKTPKCGSKRFVPITGSVQTALDAVRNVSKNTFPETFIFEQLDVPGIPVTAQFFRHAFDRELAAIGILGEWPRWNKEKEPEGYVNEQKRRNLTFHSLRHTNITLCRLAGITDVEIQALAGHKDGRMMNNYTHAGQVLDFNVAREKLERALNSA